MKTGFLVFYLCLSSLLSAQEILIPYRDGKLWGLCDTLANIKVKPQYDGILLNNYNGHYIVSKGGKMGLITASSTRIEPSYEHLSFLDTNLLRARQKTLQSYLLDFDGKQIWTFKNFRISRFGRNFEVPLYLCKENDSNKLIAYDPQKKTVQLVYSTDKRISDYSGGIVSYSIFPRIKIGDSLKHVQFNETNRTVEIVNHVSSKTEIPSRTYERSYPAFTQIISIEYKNGQANKHNYSFPKGNERLATEHVQSIPLPENAEFLATHAYSENVGPFAIEKGDSTIEFRSYLVFRLKGKLGLVLDTTVIPAAYDTIGWYYRTKQSGPFFMVGKRISGKMLWGLVDAEGKELIPCAYDTLEPWMQYYGDEAYIRAPHCYSLPLRFVQGFIAQKGKWYSVFDVNGKNLLKAQQARITLDGYHLQVKAGNSYGFFKSIDMYCQAVFPYPVYLDFNYHGIWMFQLRNSKNEFIGYANGNGLVYFRE